MKVFILLTLLHLSLFSLSQKKLPVQEFQSLGWLQGSWKGVNVDKPFYEAWRWANDSVLVNLAIEVKNGDTLIKESGALIWKNGIVTLGQKPNWWFAVRLLPNELVLRNDSLPYSNTIIWLHTKEDHWFTILEHPKATVYYDMTREPALDKKVTEWLKQSIKKN